MTARLGTVTFDVYAVPRTPTDEQPAPKPDAAHHFLRDEGFLTFTSPDNGKPIYVLATQIEVVNAGHLCTTLTTIGGRVTVKESWEEVIAAMAAAAGYRPKEYS